MNRPTTLPMALIAVFVSAATTLGQHAGWPVLRPNSAEHDTSAVRPGIVSLSTRRETKIVFSPDGRDAFLGTVVNGGFTIQMTTQTDGHWSPLATPAFIGAAMRRNHSSRRTGITCSSSDKPTSGRPPVRMASGAGSTAAGTINTTAEEWYPSITSDGTLYFSSSIGNPTGGYNIWRSTLLCRRNLCGPERLSSLIDSPTAGATDPWIAPDANYILFGSRVAGGFGQVDQYLSLRQPDGSWGSRMNLGSTINTSAIEYASSVSPDGKYYFFSRPSTFSPFATGDIYWVDARAAGIPVPEPASTLTMLALAVTWDIFLVLTHVGPAPLPVAVHWPRRPPRFL